MSATDACNSILRPPRSSSVQKFSGADGIADYLKFRLDLSDYQNKWADLILMRHNSDSTASISSKDDPLSHTAHPETAHPETTHAEVTNRGDYYSMLVEMESTRRREQEINDFVQPGFADDSINVNCVLTWRLVRQDGAEPGVFVDLHNGWIHPATKSDEERSQSLIDELRRVENGSFPRERALVAAARIKNPLLYGQRPDRY